MSDALEKDNTAAGKWILEVDADDTSTSIPSKIVAVGPHRHEYIAKVWATDFEYGAEHARRIVASVNALVELTVEAIEGLTSSHILAAVSSQAVESRRVGELEEALQEAWPILHYYGTPPGEMHINASPSKRQCVEG